MITCPKCNSTTPDDSWFCDQCGEKLMFCPKCGVPRKGKRCSMCGSVLLTAEDLANQPKTTASNAASAPQQNAAQAARPQTNVQPSAQASAQQNSVQSAPAGRVAPTPNFNAPKRLVRVDDTSQVVVLKDGAIIGRTTGDYVNVFGSCPYVSGRHGCLRMKKPDEWYYSDLGSTNGTVLNGTSVVPNNEYRLTKGNIIEIGFVKFRVE